jgi:hypothetical protein
MSGLMATSRKKSASDGWINAPWMAVPELLFSPAPVLRGTGEAPYLLDVPIHLLRDFQHLRLRTHVGVALRFGGGSFGGGERTAVVTRQTAGHRYRAIEASQEGPASYRTSSVSWVSS